MLFTLFGGLSVVAALLYFILLNKSVLSCFDDTYMRVMLSGTIMITLFQVSHTCSVHIDTHTHTHTHAHTVDKQLHLATVQL